MAKRVLHVIRSLEAGGAERVVVEYALHHDVSRYSPEVCCLDTDGRLAGTLRDAGIPVHTLRRGRRVDIGVLVQLVKLISKRRFDVVHSHGSGAMAFAVPAAVITGTPVIVRTEHNVVYGKSWQRRLLRRLAALREDAQIAVSEAVRLSHIRDRGTPAARFVTVRNGIASERLDVHSGRDDVSDSLGISRNALVALSVGSLTEQKDYKNLIEAAAMVVARFPDIVFLIAGGGGLEDDLVSAASALGVGDQVRFLGERDDVPLLLRRADIMVNSSAWEGLPITILEAMAAGVPTVATDVGGTAEVIAGDDCGLVVPSRDPESLAAAILKLAESPELREQLSSRAREIYLRRYTAERMIRETEALYDVCRQRSAHLVVSGRVRILYMIGGLARGGAERQLTELVTRVDLERFEPVVCSLAPLGALAELIERAGVRVLSLEKRPGVSLVALLRLVRLIRELRPAVLHTYLPPANWRGLVAGRATAVPLIVSSVRNVDFHLGFVTATRDRMLAVLVDVMVANAEAVRDYVVNAHWVARARMRVIYNGICIDRLYRGGSDLPSSSGNAHSGGTVVIVASLTPKKDHETFLASARLVVDALPDTRFVIVGDGGLKEHLVNRTAELGLKDCVAFIGETAAVGLHLSEADVSVLTSRREGCSNVILESMALARPVVATDVGGNRELVDDGVTGFLVDVGDVEGLACRVVDLLADPPLRRRMGKAGRERVLDRFVVERMIADTVALYEEKLDARVPGLMDWTRTRKARYGSEPIAEHKRESDLEGART